MWRRKTSQRSGPGQPITHCHHPQPGEIGRDGPFAALFDGVADQADDGNLAAMVVTSWVASGSSGTSRSLVGGRPCPELQRE